MARSKSDIELSTAEAKLYAKLAGEATDVASTEDFKAWAQTSVRKLFPHEMLIAGVAHRNGPRVAVDRLVPAGFPMAFINAVTARDGAFTCPTLEIWFQQGQPQLYQPNPGDRSSQALRPAKEFDAYDLKNVAAHGVPDLSGRYATYFSFSQIPKSLTKRHSDLLELLVPQLHHAYVQATAGPKFGFTSDHPIDTTAGSSGLAWAQGFGLSTRELQVLYWLSMGKTNDQIAHATRRARDTVKHQVSGILAKLNVCTRSEAVVLAIRVGILPERRQLPEASRSKIVS